MFRVFILLVHELRRLFNSHHHGQNCLPLGMQVYRMASRHIIVTRTIHADVNAQYFQYAD